MEKAEGEVVGMEKAEGEVLGMETPLFSIQTSLIPSKHHPNHFFHPNTI